MRLNQDVKCPTYRGIILRVLIKVIKIECQVSKVIQAVKTELKSVK